MRRFLSVATIFWGAFLLFGVQPMVGNTLLPVYGGTAAVWTVCLCAFQALLLVGYGYAHLAGGRTVPPGLSSRLLHVGAVLLSAGWVVAVSIRGKSLLGHVALSCPPALSTLVSVALLAGIPYTLLSSNSSLVQAWAARGGEKDVYSLYAVSNLGSLCGLLAYPLLVEPNAGLPAQWRGFAAGLALHAVLLGGLAILTPRSARGREPETDVISSEGGPAPAENASHPLRWFLLSALSCFLLNGVTAHICNDVVPLPLLWSVFLALYLLSYIIGFMPKWSGARKWAVLATLPLILAAAWFYGTPNSGKIFFAELFLSGGLILLGGWVIHGRLYDLRPGDDRVTNYYLMVAAGGAAGGGVASLLFPRVFSFIAEYPAGLVLLGALCLAECARNFTSRGKRALTPAACCGALVLFAAFLSLRGTVAGGEVLARVRNFYGCGRVRAERMTVRGGTGYVAHIFEHGGVLHGFQVREAGLEQTPTLCFTPHAGGLSIVSHPKYATKDTLRVAVAGMGMGTLAAYARPGDTYRFYEINPQVVDLARDTRLFTFLSGCAGNVEVVTDDARRALEKERDAGEPPWDVLIIDVFSGDSIPPHMATREAIRLYLDRLAPDGILSFHLTNWHLALSPMVKAAAREFNLHLQGYGCWADKYSMGSYWAFLTRKPADFFIRGKHGRVDFSKIRDMGLMTDRRHSLLPYISLDPMPEFEEGGRDRQTPALTSCTVYPKNGGRKR